MTMWSPRGLDSEGPVYLAIADALARDVAAGRLRAGDRLPTHRALARQLGVNVMTITRAYGEAARQVLVARGLWERLEGRLVRPPSDGGPVGPGQQCRREETA